MTRRMFLREPGLRQPIKGQDYGSEGKDKPEESGKTEIRIIRNRKQRADNRYRKKSES